MPESRNRQKLHPLYGCWRAMKRRSYNPNCQQYKWYGGRGIVVCERWKNSFAAFLEDMGERLPAMTLDRIDTNGNYEPENCRWISRKGQSNNMRSNRLLTFQGETKTLSQWAAQLGIPSTRLAARINKLGMSVDRALSSTRNLSERALFEHNGEIHTISEWAHRSGIKTATLWRRIRVYRMPFHLAISYKGNMSGFRQRMATLRGVRRAASNGAPCASEQPSCNNLLETLERRLHLADV